MKKRIAHDIFFKEVYSNTRYCLDIFKLVLTPSEFALFDWTSLKSEISSFIDSEQQEKRMDLTFSVNLKRSKKAARILFLLEHKSYQDSGLLLQVLEYQTGIYRHLSGPVIPILVYHGKEKKWRGSLNFQDSLVGMTPGIRRKFKKNILDFTCRLLNIQELNLDREAKELVTTLVLLILQQIWRLDAGVMKKFFLLGTHLKERERIDLMMKGINYVRQFDPSFSWKRLKEIEKKSIKREEDRIMFSLQDNIKEARAEGMEKGIQKGMEKGREEGREKGREEGREEERRKLALSMLKDGLNGELIEKHTGLSQKEIEGLRG